MSAIPIIKSSSYDVQTIEDDSVIINNIHEHISQKENGIMKSIKKVCRVVSQFLVSTAKCAFGSMLFASVYTKCERSDGSSSSWNILSTSSTTALATFSAATFVCCVGEVVEAISRSGERSEAVLGTSLEPSRLEQRRRRLLPVVNTELYVVPDKR